ncbi:MAG: hypothetical protein JMDDDDMK_03536 [Acidobacteria bacterium]|nr:hypothetical protein [Acidobacteriota bacterium]
MTDDNPDTKTPSDDDLREIVCCLAREERSPLLPKPIQEREEEDFRPIRVQGQPLSETIIEERR